MNVEAYFALLAVHYSSELTFFIGFLKNKITRLKVFCLFVPAIFHLTTEKNCLGRWITIIEIQKQVLFLRKNKLKVTQNITIKSLMSVMECAPVAAEGEDFINPTFPVIGPIQEILQPQAG